jgi:hypothetical protein
MQITHVNYKLTNGNVAGFIFQVGLVTDSMWWEYGRVCFFYIVAKSYK